MPNRIIKESICYSDSIKGLSWFEEVFFYRLIVNADDYGRLDGRKEMLLARLFPLRRDITESTVEKALNALTAAGMVQVYKYDQRPFLQLTAWEKHQQVRAKKSKFPAPDISCNQMISNVPVIQSLSESLSESESNTESNACAHEAGTDEALKVIEYYQKVTGRDVTPSRVDMLSGYISQGMETELICELINYAVDKGVKNVWQYVERAIIGNLESGITTLKAYELERDKRRAQSGTWRRNDGSLSEPYVYGGEYGGDKDGDSL